MRHLFAVLLAALLSIPSLAWGVAATVAQVPGAQRSITITCASGTCDAPTAAPTAATAMDLDSPTTVEVCVAADASQTLTIGTVTLLAYRWDSAVGRWAPAPTLNVVITAPGSTRDLCYEGYTINSSRGFMLLIPSSVAVSSGGVTIRMLASGTKKSASPAL